LLELLSLIMKILVISVNGICLNRLNSILFKMIFKIITVNKYQIHNKIQNNNHNYSQNYNLNNKFLHIKYLNNNYSQFNNLNNK
jgi:hypothetical protein